MYRRNLLSRAELRGIVNPEFYLWRRVSKSYIYALVDPTSKEVRYVGQSVNPERRYRGHLKWDSGKLGRWIKQLKISGLKPALTILGKFPESEITKQEARFMKQYKNLFNINAAHKPSVSSKCGFRVKCIDTGEIFGGYAHASRKFDCCSSSIKNRCDDGKRAYPSDMRFKRIYNNPSAR